MKANNKIYAFFVFLALLFWNPLSYYLFYRNSITTGWFETSLVFWISFILGLVIMYLILANKLSSALKNLVLTLSFTAILFSFFVVINSTIGLLNKNSTTNTITGKPDKKGLIYKPHSKVRYQTVEFDFMANVNSIGLRDHEMEIDKAGKYRILCFGDSFTYGWGVDVDNSWPKKLETYFHNTGHSNIEVVNCGQPGQFTSKYKENLQNVVPVLKPDVVLVGVLQSDDLSQVYSDYYNKSENPDAGTSKQSSNVKLLTRNYLKASFGNILSLFDRKSTSSDTIDVKSNWKQASNNMVNGFTKAQRYRYSMLPDTIRTLFTTGNLNPGMLNSYVNQPNSLAVFNDPSHPVTQKASKLMAKDFEEMKAICNQYNCDLIFVNIPLNLYTGHRVIRTPEDVFNSFFENRNSIDSIYRSIAEINELPYIELTSHFVDLKNKEKYYFLFDGHPNEYGYEEIANEIGRQLIEENRIIIN